MKQTKFIIYIFLLSVTVAGYSSYDLVSGKLVLHGAEKDSIIIQRLMEFAIAAEQINSGFFQKNLDQQVDIFLAPSEAGYLKFNPEHIPEWSSGIAFYQARKIILKPGLYFDPVRYRETMIHEITHIYMGDILQDGRVPVWLNEGTAMLLSGKHLTWQESIDINNAISSGKLPDLAAIDSLIRFPDMRAQLGYLASFLAVQYFVKLYGPDGLAALIKDTAGISSLDAVFFKHTGHDFFTFELNWYDDLKERFRWMVFLQFDTWYWIGLILIIFVGFIVRYIHNKKIYSKWENENIV